MSVVQYTAQQRAWLDVMIPAAELAKQIAGTEFVPKSLRNNPAAIAAAILFGDEVGFGPMQSLAKITVIEGKPALASEAQRALILRAGHDLWIEEATTTKVTVAGRRKDSEQISRVTWTMDDAKRANLAGRPSWRMYPRQMLLARATAELARMVFADAVGGLAAIEELEDPGDFEEAAPGNGAETVTRRTRKRSGTALKPAASFGSDTAAPIAPLLPGEVVEAEADATALDESGVPTPPPASDPSDSADAVDGAPAPTAGNTIAASTRDKPMTKAQRDKLGVLVGWLREDSEQIATSDLYRWVAKHRNVEVVLMTDLTPVAYSEDGVLHWGPLLATLTRAEASALIDALVTKYGDAPVKEKA